MAHVTFSGKTTSAAELSEITGLSKRQVQRLAVAGDIDGVRVAALGGYHHAWTVTPALRAWAVKRRTQTKGKQHARVELTGDHLRELAATINSLHALVMERARHGAYIGAVVLQAATLNRIKPLEYLMRLFPNDSREELVEHLRDISKCEKLFRHGDPPVSELGFLFKKPKPRRS